MSRSFLIDRTSLGLTALQLWSPPSRLVPEGGFLFGTPVENRTVVDSPIVSGSYQTAITRGHQMATCVVHCSAETEDGLGPVVEEVVKAFGQFTYRLDWQLDGLRGAWQCDKAFPIVGPGGTPDEFWLSFHAQQLTFQIPRHPTPLMGAI